MWISRECLMGLSCQILILQLSKHNKSTVEYEQLSLDLLIGVPPVNHLGSRYLTWLELFGVKGFHCRIIIFLPLSYLDGVRTILCILFPSISRHLSTHNTHTQSIHLLFGLPLLLHNMYVISNTYLFLSHNFLPTWRAHTMLTYCSIDLRRNADSS